ncbi:MAG TPA: AsmA-like C-terminal region-containing protein [Candidatus Polarisedimenticolaceae bacterium]
MTVRRKRILIALAIAASAVAAIVLAARAVVPSWLQGKVEEVASRALGRELRIGGPFDVSYSGTPTLTAGGITLANLPWGSEPSMIRVGRIRVVVDLASLGSGPVRILDLEVDDVRLLLEADGDGRGNWVFPMPPPPSAPRPGPPVLFDHVVVRGVAVVVRPRPDAAPVELGVEALEARLDPSSRMIDVEGKGRFDDLPWELAGRLGTYERLFEIRDVEQALTGRLGNSTLEVRGRIRDPLDLGAPDLEVGVAGPDIVAALGHLGLRSPLTGAFELRGRLTPVDDGVHVEATGSVAGVTAGARGVVNKLTTFEKLDLRVDAAGPNLAEAGAWIGVESLPSRPFALDGRLRREDGRFSVDDARLRAGPTSVAVSGVFGPPPRWIGTELEVHAEGRDLSELSGATRLRLPPGPFGADGRLSRRENGLAIESAALRFREARARASGVLGEPPGLSSLDLTGEAEGPDLSWFSGLAGVDLPARPFRVRGRVARDGDALALDAVEGRLGEDALSLNGRLVPVARLTGSDVTLRATGPDLAELAALAGIERAPAEAFDVRGRVRVATDGWDLEGVEGSVGRVTARLDGRVGASSSLRGSAHGPSLSDLAAWGVPGDLPADPFSVEGGLRVDGGVYRAEGVVANVGQDHAAFDGVLGSFPGLVGLDGEVKVSGPSLAGLARFFAAAERLPVEAYAVAGRVRRTSSGYALEGVFGKAGETAIRLDGTLGAGEADLRFDATGPDTSLLASLAGTPLPDGAFEAHGRVARRRAGLLCDEVTVALGEARARVSGTVGAPPDFEGTDLHVHASGPDLSAALGPVTGLPMLPTDAFEISLEVAGNAERFASNRFSARLGGSDLEGRVSMRLDGRPFVEADLRSGHIDVSALRSGFGVEPPNEESAPAAEPRRQVFSEAPLTLDALRKLDATLRLEVAELATEGLELRDVVVGGTLRDGALRVDGIRGVGVLGGRFTANLAMEPVGDRYRMSTTGRLDGGRLAPPGSKKTEEDTLPLDVEFDLRGEGRSLHDIAATANGHVLAVLGSGRLPNTLSSSLTSGVLRSLLDALNPFRKSSEHTDVECGVAAAFVTEGKAAVEPIAARTDKMTVVGRGKVDFETEKIDFTWTIKPRRGVGVSATSITNPYIKLGGTLAAPSLDAKPIEAAASTGAAVATAGITILVRGIYDRITAEKKVCVRALEKAREQMEARSFTPPD